MRPEKISEAISELRDDDDLARVVGEALQLISRRGKKAWDALFEMLSSDEESLEEIENAFGDFIDKGALAKQYDSIEDED